jgi:hypothetical protein
VLPSCSGIEVQPPSFEGSDKLTLEASALFSHTHLSLLLLLLLLLAFVVCF